MGDSFKVTVSWQIILLTGMLILAQNTASATDCHVWENHEITLTAVRQYDNFYTDVTCWVDLEGPGFSRRIYGFWDGGRIFKVRVVATEPGGWSWKSGSNQKGDSGLNNQSGRFTAATWTEAEKVANPVRRGFIVADPQKTGTPCCMRTVPLFSWWVTPGWQQALGDFHSGVRVLQITMNPDPVSVLKMPLCIENIRDSIRSAQ